MTWTFLVPHAGNPSMLEACLDSIRRRHGDVPVVVGLRGEPYAEAARFVAQVYRASCVVTPDNGDDIHLVFRDLLGACETPYAVYMEADCLLRRRLETEMERIEETHGFLGVEDLIPWPEGRPGTRFNGTHFRYAPGCHTASFWMADVGRFKDEIGVGHLGGSRHRGEPYYDLSLSMRAASWTIDELAVEHPYHDRWGFATYYGSSVLHMWFGGWRTRNNIEDACGVPREYLQRAEANLLADYWNGATI